MAIDANIALQGRGVEIENPLSQYANFLQAQSFQNQNALAPLKLQQMQFSLMQSQRDADLVGQVLARRNSIMQGDPSQGNSLMGGSPIQGGNNSLVSGGQGGAVPGDGIPYSMQDLADLSLAGHKGAETMLKVKQAAAQGQVFKPGETYVVNGQQFTVPMLDKGMRMGANGVEEIPHYSETNAKIQGDQAGATEAAKLLPLGYVGQDGRPLGGTVGQYLGKVNPQQAAPMQNNQSAKGPQGLDVSKLTPQQIAGLARTDPTAFANGTKDFQQTSAPNYTPPTVGMDGSPVSPQVQQALTQLANSRDPAKLQQFAQTLTQQISQQLPPGPKQDAAMQSLQKELSGIQQSWQAPQAPQAQQSPSGMPVLQSATEAAQAAAQVELQKQQGMDKLKLDAGPKQAYANKASEALQTMGDNIGTQLSGSQSLMQRIEMSRDALKRTQAGGGADTKVQVAEIAQALHMPNSIVNGIAGGSLSAAQEFNKFAAQEALETMRQSLSNDDGKGSQGNRVAMQLFIKNNPNLTTDPNAIEKIYNFQTEQHNQLLNKHDMFVKFATDPNTVKDPAVFVNQYAHSQVNSGNVNPQMVQGQARGTTPMSAPTAPTGFKYLGKE